MEPGVAVVIGVCAFLALWYGAGHLYNRRRGQRLFRWLEAGLGALGGEIEAGWIGSSAAGARFNVVHAAPPFRRMEITLLLENREILPLWLFDHLRGRRDRLIIRATLRSSRRGEIEIGPARRKAARQRQGPWEWLEEPHRLATAYQGPGAQQQAAALEPWLQSYGAYLRRFYWRKRDPHILLEINLNGLIATPSDTFLNSLQAVLEKAIHIDK
jgi:hypothetical protein